MNHTENYKKYAYRSILIMMLGVAFFILFGSRLISQNVYASYDPQESYAGGDILLFEKVWEDDQEKDRPNSISFKATLVKTIGQDEEIEIELTNYCLFDGIISCLAVYSTLYYCLIYNKVYSEHYI